MTSGEKSLTKTGRMRRATFSQVCQWILTAWSSVKESTITTGFWKAGLLRDAGSTTDADAPPKHRAALIPRAPALGCLHRTRISPRHPAVPLHTYSSFFSVFPGAIRSRRAEKIDSTPKRSLHAAVRRFSARCEPGVMRRKAQAQGRICLGRKVTLRAQTKERLSATKQFWGGDTCGL